ncbi:hypothetical protein B0A48_11569 [Cryoendolithus antarcticus]|uniref:Major facilitator superfamily (MFS) profile domain-containing protein n=1 Tax=Cryoendolithus antarcticus TaxID=1507870 RepID=A0A1V8SVY4_9PEZI|nr:hypothetical protein B0A48_11569 [Cryoendolithus antarcticus]
MGRRYLGGSGERLMVWISVATSTVLVFYGYDQGVSGNVIINENFPETCGKYDEAREVLAALEGNGTILESGVVQTQFAVVKDILDREHLNKYSWWQLITGRGPSGLLRRMILAVAFFFLFFASFGMGVLGVPWLCPIEINALEMRTKGASLAMATNCICNYAVVQATLPGIDDLGYKFCIVWAVICFAFIPITCFFYPETANRSLEDIDRFFETKPDVLIFGTKLATQLSRPQQYFDMDEEIARKEEKEGGWSGKDVEKEKEVIGIEERV